MKDRNRVWVWLAGLVLVAVLVGSLVPGNMTVVPFDLPDQKHFLAYACLGFLFVMALRVCWWQAILVAAGLALLGLGVELLQELIPKREFRWVDVRANGLGAITGAAIGWVVVFAVARIKRKGSAGEVRYPGSGPG